MNIVYVEIQNMLGITEAKIEPGKVTLIEGKNGAGKSAAIDAILSAFSAKGIDGELVTKGADRGRVYIKLDDGTMIKRQYSPDGKTNVRVTTAAGDEKRAPQGWLDELFGHQIVNPVTFLKMTTAEKRKVLLSALPITVSQEDLQEWFGDALPIDTDQHGLEVLAEAEKVFYERRKSLNATGKSLQGEIEVISKDIPADFDAAEWENVDTSNLTQQLQDIGRIEAEKQQKLNEAIRLDRQADGFAADSNSLYGKAAQLYNEIKRLTDEHAQVLSDADEAFQAIAATNTMAQEIRDEAEAIVVPDKSEIEKKLHDYSQAQRVLQQIANRDRLQAEFNQAKADATAVDAKVAIARQKPKELLAQAKFPVEGLEFTEDNILVNGLDIDSLSDGEKLKLGVAIAQSTVGKLGCILIDGAETLDPYNLRQLMADANADNDHHYIITRVTDGELTVTTTADDKQEALFDA